MRLRSFALVAAIAVLPLPSRNARAADKQACVAASDAAQKLRDQKKLRAARKQLLVCAQEDCPAVVKKDCVDWLAEVDDQLPTIVLAAKDASGNDLFDAKVTVDGEPFADKLDGSAMPIDPGVHTIVWTSADKTVEQKVVINASEKNRVLTATFGAPASSPPAATPPAVVTTPPPSPSPSPSPSPVTDKSSTVIPPAAYVFGAVGVAGLVGFAYFGISGKNDVQRLRDTCAPYCDKSDETPARTKLIVADISLGVSLVSLGVATAMVLTAPKKHETASIQVQATPIAGGGWAGIGGRF